MVLKVAQINLLRVVVRQELSLERCRQFLQDLDDVCVSVRD